MTMFYEVKITGPEIERTEIHYSLDRAQECLQDLLKTFSSEHTVDLKKFSVELMESLDCHAEEADFKSVPHPALRRTKIRS